MDINCSLVPVPSMSFSNWCSWSLRLASWVMALYDEVLSKCLVLWRKMGKFCGFARFLVIKDPEWLSFHYLHFCGSPCGSAWFHANAKLAYDQCTIINTTRAVIHSSKSKTFCPLVKITELETRSQWLRWLKTRFREMFLEGMYKPKTSFCRRSKGPKALHDCSVSTPSSCLSSWQKINLHTMSQELVQVCRSHIQTQKCCTGRVSKLVSRKLWEMSIPWTSRYVPRSMGFFCFSQRPSGCKTLLHRLG